MLGFNHTLAGSIIAVITPTPLVPFVALGSHYLLDMTPHFGRSETVHPYTTQFKRLLVADAVLCTIALLFAMWLFPDMWLVVTVGAFFGALPDFFWLLKHRGPKWFDKFLSWSERIQWGERPYGWIFDVFYALMMVITLYLLAS